MSPLTLCAIAIVAVGIVVGIIGEVTHVATLKPSPKGITVMVTGGGDVFDMPFPEDQVYRQLDNFSEYSKVVRVGRIITRGDSYGQKIAIEWANLNHVEVVQLAKPRMFQNIYRTMLEAGQPDVIVRLAGKDGDWSLVQDETRSAGFENVHWNSLVSVDARPEWITDFNTVERPDQNKRPRLSKRVPA